jgi:hypothetical protein
LQGLPVVIITHHDKGEYIMRAKRAKPSQIINIRFPEKLPEEAMLHDVRRILNGEPSQLGAGIYYKADMFSSTHSPMATDSPKSPLVSPNTTKFLPEVPCLPGPQDTKVPYAVWIEANLGSLNGDLPVKEVIGGLFNLFPHEDTQFRFVTATPACLESTGEFVSELFSGRKVAYGTDSKPSLSMSREYSRAPTENTDLRALPDTMFNPRPPLPPATVTYAVAGETASHIPEPANTAADEMVDVPPSHTAATLAVVETERPVVTTPTVGKKGICDCSCVPFWSKQARVNPVDGLANNR